MIGTNYSKKPAGYAGQIARGDQSLSKAWAMPNREELKPIQSGVFVCLNTDDFGVKLITADSDKIAGITVNTGAFKRTQPKDQCNVAHIGVGDSVWAQMDSENPLKYGDDVKIMTTADKNGFIGSTGTITTPYWVVRVSGDVAEIARKEVVA